VKKKVILGLLMLALAGILTTSALAAPQNNLFIDVENFIDKSLGETFDAFGPAVTSGRVCAKGTVDEVSIRTSGPPNGDFEKWHVTNRFTCEDGSGTFVVRVQITFNLIDSTTKGRWMIVEGTGNYADLSGKGSVDGTPINIGLIISDNYVGIVN